MKKILLTFFTVLASLSLYAADDAKVTISDMSLYVAEGEQIDEDDDFLITFNYKCEILDSSIMPSGKFWYSVYDENGTAVYEDVAKTFAPTFTSSKFYVSYLEAGKEYTIKLDKVVITDNSKIDWETVFTGEEILTITEGLPTLKFTPLAGEVLPIDIKNMKMTYDKNASLDEDGDYMVTFNYDATFNDESLNAANTFAIFKYQVYDENYNLVDSGNRDFDLGETTRNVYVSGLTPGKSYTFMVTGLVVMGPGDQEVLNLVSGLPKLNFKVKDPNAPQAISMTGMSFSVADGEKIDEDGDFKVTFNYTATINETSVVNYPFATISFELYDAENNKVASSLIDFNVENNSKNFYISNLEAGKTYTLVATIVEIQDFMTMDMLCETTQNLPSLTFTVGGATAIQSVKGAQTKTATKVLRNGKILILKNGKTYGVDAVLVK